MTINIWTDGCCSGNPGPGGWGIVLKSGKRVKELSGGATDTTNNRMELTAAIEALKALKSPSKVVLTTDSEYVQLGITEYMPNWKLRGWRNSKRKPVKNVDLWQELDALNQEHEVEWCWVRGHTGDKMNERADLLAESGMLIYAF